MRRKTFAHNGFVIGFLIGLLVWAKTESTPLAVLAGIAVSVVSFIIIKWLENLVYSGAEAAERAVENAYQKRKGNSQTSGKRCVSCGASLEGNNSFCTKCGTKQ